MEVLCKFVTIIIDRRTVGSVEFHDVLLGFISWIGTGTYTLEAKLPHQIAGMWQEVIYEIFVDIHNSYDMLYRGIALEILKV